MYEQFQMIQPNITNNDHLLAIIYQQLYRYFLQALWFLSQ